MFGFGKRHVKKKHNREQSIQSPERSCEEIVDKIPTTLPARTTRSAFHSIAGARPENQDRAITIEACVSDRRFTLLIVADGMGGTEGGETASRICIEEVAASIARSLVEGLDGKTFEPARVIRRACHGANRKIQEDAQANPERADMGTTLTLGLSIGDELYVANVGDSRLFLWQDGELKLLTRDDSLVEYLVSVGDLSESKARSHPLDNQILHALGAGEDLGTLRITRHRLLPGDVVLAASDGFWKYAESIAPPLLASLADDTRVDAFEQLAKSLVDKALQEGSDDNITVALVQHPTKVDEATAEQMNSIGGNSHGR